MMVLFSMALPLREQLDHYDKKYPQENQANDIAS